jgi:sialate O-acetylesterase
MKKKLVFGALFAFISTVIYAQMSEPVFNVLDYGAVGDGQTVCTEAIQQALDACEGTGGTVYLPEGIFRSASIRIKSKTTLHIDPEATLFGVADQSKINEDYPKLIPETNNWNKNENARGFLLSYQADEVKITGGGTIDGNGKYDAWHVYASPSLHESERPIPIWIVQSTHVEISNVKVKDGAMWTIVPFESDYVTIRNVDINSNIMANRDGIDIVDSHHVLIEDCTFYCDDDAICPKSGHARGVVDLIVRNCVINKSARASGIKLGTLGYGSFKDMLFENITINDVNHAAIAIESVDGADIENLTFRNITISNTGSPFFIILGDRGRTPTGVAHKIGKVENIVFENIKAVDMKKNIGCPISGFKKGNTTYTLKNISFKNVDVDFKGGLKTIPGIPSEYNGQYPEVDMWKETPAHGFFLRHIEGISFEDCHFTVSPEDEREFIVQQNVSGFTMENCTQGTLYKTNLLNKDTYSGDSGFLTSTPVEGLWDGSTADGVNDSKAKGETEAWIEFDFGKEEEIAEANLWQDNGGNRVTHWKVMYWTGESWEDIFPYVVSNTAGWQYQKFDIKTSKVRFYAKCVSGGYVSIHEIELFTKQSLYQFDIPAILSDNMILQRNSSVRLWGRAFPDTGVNILTSWNQANINVTASADGKWETIVTTGDAGGPYSITISSGERTKTINNVLLGEVWICAGQSNMAMPLKGGNNMPPVEGLAAIVAESTAYSDIRMFTVGQKTSLEKQLICSGVWRLASTSAETFSATGYLYALELRKKLGVPVGMVHLSWGGSTIQAWTSREVLQLYPEVNLNITGELTQRSPTALYNAMFNPVSKYSVKGVIWYQGEENVSQANLYAKLFPAFIRNWRNVIGQGEIPFHYVQLVPYEYQGSTQIAAAQLREVQLQTLDSLNNVRMITTGDLGEEKNIHPAKKKEIGQRLAYWSLLNTYNYNEMPYTNIVTPVCRKKIISGNKIILEFENSENGLVLQGTPQNSFEIAGNNGIYYPANAQVLENRLEVWATEVSVPKNVRYAFTNYYTPLLFNNFGIPVSPFRTNNVPETVTSTKTVKENSIKIFPNPAKDELSIENGEMEIEDITITDFTGKKLSTFNFQPSPTSIDISALPAGIYFITVGGKTQKFVKM